MRDFNTPYIPDLTQRYPEGFGGVDRYTDFMYLESLGMNEEIPYEDDEDAQYESLFCIFVDEMGLTDFQAEKATEDVLRNGLTVEEAFGKHVVDPF